MTSRRPLLILALAALVAFSAAPARAETHADATAVIRSMADTVLAILGDKGMARAAREARFRTIYRANFDHATVAPWIMGRPWSGATPAQRRDFLQLFEIYIIKVYSAQLATYRGQTFQVQGSEADGIGAVVQSRIVDKAADRIVDIKWRMRQVGGKWMVRDVVIENISMSLNQRRELAAVYQRRGGTVDGLLAALREKIAELDRK